MGVDMRVLVEGRDQESGAWYALAEVFAGRDYALFGAMAGVRGRSLPRTPRPRGVPDDAGAIVRARYDEDSSDDTVASWLTAKEFWELTDDLVLSGGGDWGEMDVPWFNALCLVLDSSVPDEMRLVFWFDQ